MREFWKFATLQIGGSPTTLRFSCCWGGGGARGDSGGLGAFRAPKSKWKFCTRETSLVMLWLHLREGNALPGGARAQTTSEPWAPGPAPTLTMTGLLGDSNQNSSGSVKHLKMEPAGKRSGGKVCV